MVEAVPPTSHLPPIKRISTETLESLNDYIHYLRSIYNPEVRGSRRRRKPHQEKIPPMPSTITPKEACRLNHLRADPFERIYAIKWLTSLISILYADEDEDMDATQQKEKTIQNAASLIAACAGTSAAGTVARDFTFMYQSSQIGGESVIPLTVQLMDIPLDNHDFESVGAQTWGSACILSELIVDEPHTFGISVDQLKNQQHGIVQILELGAGTGLVSLTLGKLLQHLGVDATCQVEVVATDYHPSVLANLRTNVQNNFGSTNKSPISISVHQLDWSSYTSPTSPENTTFSPFDEPFDIIFGADIVYEPQHATWVQSCITHLLRKPLGAVLSHPYTPDPFFHLVMPLRATHLLESSSVEAVFTANHNSTKCSLRILTKDTITCDTATGEEVEYIYYKVGWI